MVTLQLSAKTALITCCAPPNDEYIQTIYILSADYNFIYNNFISVSYKNKKYLVGGKHLSSSTAQ